MSRRAAQALAAHLTVQRQGQNAAPALLARTSSDRQHRRGWWERLVAAKGGDEQTGGGKSQREGQANDMAGLGRNTPASRKARAASQPSASGFRSHKR